MRKRSELERLSDIGREVAERWLGVGWGVAESDDSGR